MLYTFTDRYPAMKVLDKEVLGKRVILSGFDTFSEVERAYEWGVRDICIDYFMIHKTKEQDLFNLLNKFDVVVLDPNSHKMTEITSNKEAYQLAVNNFILFFEENSELFTFAIEPKHVLPVLGVDVYIDYHNEFIDRQLPIFPVVQKEDVTLYVEHILPYVTHAVLDMSKDFNMTFMRNIESRCVEMGVQLITKSMNLPYRLEKSKASVIISDAWKQGTKYGTTYLYKDGNMEMKVYPSRAKRMCRMKHKGLIEAMGVNFEGLIQDIPADCEHLNTLSWLGFADRLSVNPHGVWWLDPEQYGEMQQRYIGKSMDDPVFNQLALGDEGRLKKRELVLKDNPEMAESPHSKFKFIDGRQLVAGLCNTCSVRDLCPQFTPNASCAFKSNAMVNNREDLRNALGAFFTMSLERVQQAAFQEKLEGGELSPELTKLISETFKNAKVLNEIQKEGSITVGMKDGKGRVISAEGDMGTMDLVRDIMDGVGNQRTIDVEPTDD